MGTVLVDGQAEVRLRGFALAFDRLAKASTFVFNANSSNFISEVSCSLSSSSESVNCENSSVSFVMKYCPTSTVFKNPASVQIFINRSGCGSLSTRSWYFYNKSSCARSSVEGVGVFVNKLAGSNNGSDCPASACLPVLAWQVLHSSHKPETAP